MGMQLNIKSDEAYRLAARLAELRGESLTAAVTEALRQRVEEEERTREKESMIRDVLALAAEIRAELDKAGEPVSSNHDWMYDDETGLPVW